MAKARTKKVKEVEKPLTKADLKLTSLEDLKDETLGKVGTPKRDAFEDELKADLDIEAFNAATKPVPAEQLKQVAEAAKAHIVNLEFDDTKTTGGIPEAATPAPDQKYGAELAQALEHITQGKSIQVDLKRGREVDELQEGVEKLVIVDEQDGAVARLRKIGYILSQADTKYLRIAVRYAEDQTLKNELLVFHKSV